MQCSRLCIVSKIFCNCVKVTVPSQPKENGVPVKINILLRFPQANLFLAKIIVVDFTGVCFDAIVRPDRVTSEKTETSVTESLENKVSGWKGIRTNTPLSPKIIITTGTTNTHLSPKFIIILDALHGYKIRHV